MKISGIAGTVLLGFGALFKIQHWPLAGTMTTLGAVTLALVFMPSALGVLWKETHSRKRLFLFISAFLAGMLFYPWDFIQNTTLARGRYNFNPGSTISELYSLSPPCLSASSRIRKTKPRGRSIFLVQ